MSSTMTIRIYSINPESRERRDHTPRRTIPGGRAKPFASRWPACRCHRCKQA